MQLYCRSRSNSFSRSLPEPRTVEAKRLHTFVLYITGTVGRWEDNTVMNQIDVRFMSDSTEGKDGAKETIMDYVISWMLRRAQNKCSSEKPVLYDYCRKFLGRLIEKEITPSDNVVVETWKQYERIDLWVYVKVGDEEHDILIEDKYYSRIHDNQPGRYKSIFDEWRKGNRPKSHPHYWILSCFDNKESTDIYNAAAKDSGFKILFWDDMLESMGIKNENPLASESDIFNEFWLEW